MHSPFIQMLRRWLIPGKRPIRHTGNSRHNNLTESLEPRTLLTVDAISLATAGTTGDAISNDPQISRDGRFVAFQSRAEDLGLVVGVDGNSAQDIFVRNIDSGAIVLISRGAGDRSGNDDSWSASMSDNGRYVTFVSFATDLVPGVTIISGPNVYVHDRDIDADGVFDEAGATRTRLLSRNGTIPTFSGNGFSGGTVLGASWSYRPVISGDGRFVTYTSTATNLLDPADGVIVTAGPNLYVTPTDGGKTILVSVNPSGTASGLLFGGGTASTPSMSADGRFISFESNYVNLVTGDTEGFPDIFVRDVFKGTTTRVSISTDGRAGNAVSREPVLSRDGRHVVFTSRASNLVDNDLNTREDIFVHDMLTRRTTLVSQSRDTASLSASGNAASPATAGPVEAAYDISDNGRYVVFTSLASDLLDPAGGVVDANGATDVYLFDRDADLDGMLDETAQGGTSTKLVSINSVGTAASNSIPATGGSTAVSISGDGRYAAFTSPGTDLIAGGTTGAAVYVRDLVAESTEFIGLTGTPFALQAGVAESGISASPLRVAFTSFALGVDPSVTDGNGDGDVFVYRAGTDIRFEGATGDGNTRIILGFSVENAAADGPVEVGVYRSVDGIFDGSDELLDTITISGGDLSVGTRKLVFDIGSGPGEIALPGAGALETDTDYQVLFVFDYLNVQTETDSDPFNDDNTGRLEGSYHLPGGPIFIHGRSTPGFENDRLIVTEVDATTLNVQMNRRSRIYDPADVSGIRFRGHAGNDFAQSASQADLLLGGAGNDELRGGPGDDIIGGGIGNDALFGESGFDTIYDGMGDDKIELGPDGGIIIATPGSDDVFDMGESGGTLDFSLARLAITMDLASNAIQRVDDEDNTVQLNGNAAYFIGTAFHDQFSISGGMIPLILDGGPGNDELIVDADGNAASFDGTTITISGFAPITVSGFERFQLLNSPATIIDDSDLNGAFTHTGFFDSSPQFPQGFNDGVKFSAANDGHIATWGFHNLVPGRYAIATSRTSAPDRATNAPFTIFDGAAGGTILSQVRVNQENEPNEFEADGVFWSNLGIVDITGTELTVELTDVGADQFVVADAVRIEPISRYTNIVDDGDDAYTGNAGNRIDGSGLFGDQEVFPAGVGIVVASVDGDGFDDIAVPPGKYWVFTTFGSNASYSTTAEFTVSNGTDSTTTFVNQQLPPDDVVIGGVGWEELGVVEITDPADLTVTLTDNSNAPVVFDSIRFEPFHELSYSVSGPVLSPIGAGESLNVEFRTLVLDSLTNQAILRAPIRLRNDGISPISFDTGLTSPGGEFSLMNSGTIELPPGAVTEVIVEFEAGTVGMFGATLDLSVFAHRQLLSGFNLTATVVDDDTPPTIRMVSPVNGSSVVEGATIQIQVEADDNVAVREVTLIVDGVVHTTEKFPYEFNIQVPYTANGILQITGTAEDEAGNSTPIDPLELAILERETHSFFDIPLFQGESIDIITDSEGTFVFADVTYVEFDHDPLGTVVVPTNDVISVEIPPLPDNGPTVVTAYVTDAFGRIITSDPFVIAPEKTLAFTGPVRRVQSLRPVISWNGDPNGVRYDIWLRDMQTGKVIRDENVIGTSWTPPRNLLLGDYRVWVRCFDAAGNTTGWNSPWDFKVELPVPGSTDLYLLSPELDATPVFGWAVAEVDYDLNGDTDILVSGEIRVVDLSPVGNPPQIFSVAPNLNIFELPQTLGAGSYDVMYRLINEAGVAGAWSPPLPVSITGSTPIGAVSGRKWHDLNANGQQEANEPGLNGWTIFLENEAGQVIASTMTMDRDLNDDSFIDPVTESGWYAFDTPQTGTFVVREEQRAGWNLTNSDFQFAVQAFQLDKDLNLHSTGKDFQNWGGLSERWLFGNGGWYFINPEGELFKWDGSPRSALTGTSVASLTPEYWMNLDLLYDSVEPGARRVRIDRNTVSAVDFSNQAQGAIEGRKWNDVNTNGLRDPGESWLNGWSVTLLDETDTVVSTSITGDRDLNNDQIIDPETESGWYVFEQLGSGLFTVLEEDRLGWSQTSPDLTIAQAAFDLDQSLNLRFSGKDFLNWGGLNERWLYGNGGWHYITPDGVLFKWDGSPRTSLTGTLVASLSPVYWQFPERLYAAVVPGRYRVHVNGARVSEVDFGNFEDINP